jgi:hypothetical protein
MESISRIMEISLPKKQSAFLWGPRKTGKTTYLRKKHKMKHYYSDQFDDIFEQALISLVNEVDDWSTIQFIAVITLYSSSHKSRGQQWIQSTIEKTYPKIFGEKGGLIMEGVSNIWIDQGLEKGRNCMKNMLIDALKIKFNNVSQPIGNFIQSIKDEEMLQTSRNLIMQ